MSDISIDNLDKGYEQSKGISDLIVNEGKDSLLEEFQLTIQDLKQHWVSSDAAEHINNLIAMYRTLGGHLNNLVGNIKNSADGIIGIQTLRAANGGGGQPGAKLRDSMDIKGIDEAVQTSGYNLDAEDAKRIYTKLKDLSDKYETFMQTINVKKDDLFNNWKKGANRESVRGAFETLDSQKEKNRGLFSNVLSKVGEAFNNSDKL